MDNHTTLFAVLDAACNEIMKMDKLSIGPHTKLCSIHNIYKTAIRSTKKKILRIRLITSLYKTYNILFPQIFSCYAHIQDNVVNTVFSDTIRIQYDEIPTMPHINEQLVDDMIREFDIFRTLINYHYQASGLPPIPIHPTTTCNDIDSAAYDDENTTSKVKVDTHEEVSPTTRPRRNIPLVNYKGTC